MKNSTLTVLLLCFVFFANARSQSLPNAQPTPSPEAALIDQILKDNRLLFGKGNFEEALQKAESAFQLSQKTGDPKRQTQTLLQVATAKFHSGKVNAAINDFKQTATLADQQNDHATHGLALNSAGVLLRTTGLFDEAFYFFQRALALQRQQGNRLGEASASSNLGTTYFNSGDVANAELWFRDALKIALEIKDTGGNARGLIEAVLLKQGYLELERKNFDSCLSTIEQLQTLVTDKSSTAFRIEFEYFAGVVNTKLNRFVQAELHLQNALDLSRQFKIRLSEAQSLGELGWVQFNLGNFPRALANVETALSMLQQDGSNSSEWRLVFYLAEIQKALGKDEDSLNSFRKSVAIVERARTSVMNTESSRAGLVALRHTVFERFIFQLMNLKQSNEALEVAEAYHARSFLDILTESRIDLRRDLSAEQILCENKLFDAITRIQKSLQSKNLVAEREKILKKELQIAESDLENYQAEILRSTPRYASIKYPHPIKPEQLSTELDANTALIEFVLGATNSYAWVVHRGKISAVTLPGRNKLNELISRQQESLTAKVSSLTMNNALQQLQNSGNQLYQKLFLPLEPHLATAKKLIIVADGSLGYLPFETLSRPIKSGGSEYLLERFAISYAPSATALQSLKNIASASAQTGYLGFGDPEYSVAKPEKKSISLALSSSQNRGIELTQLPNTRREINDIALLFPRSEQQIFLGKEACEQNVKTASLDKFRYVHFAAHGIIDEDFPARSGLVLSSESNSKDDGVLQMGEVMRLKMNADVVTLSACRTGLGKLLNGEGMIGLSRAFLYAGSKSVVVSLWNVNDGATASLMKAFYKNLQQEKSKDEALRQAKLELLKSEKRAWRHPYYWAPFVLIGEN